MSETKTADDYKAQEKNLERFMFLVDGCNDGIWDWDIHAGEFYFSKRWLEMIGYTEGELEENFNTIISLIHEDDLGEMLDVWCDYMEGVVSCYNLEYRLRKKNGDYLWVESRGISARDANGEPYRFSGFHTDITLRKEQEKLLAERTAQVAQKTKDMNSMLHNMRQGVFTVIKGNKIHPEYSSHLEKIVDTDDIVGRDVMELVFADADLGSDVRDQIEVGLSAIIEEEEMAYEFNGHLLPAEIQKGTGENKKIIQFEWVPIINDEAIIDKILVIAQDVTELRKLALAAEQQKEELDIIGQILKISMEKFNEFITSAYEYIEENHKLISTTNQKDEQVISALFRNMHTIKGNARTYEFIHLTNTIHEVEQTYDNLRKQKDTPWDERLLLHELELTKQALQRYDDVNSIKLGRKGRSTDLLTSRGTFIGNAELATLIELVGKLQTATPHAPTASTPTVSIINTLSSNLQKVGQIPLDRLVSGAKDSVASLAKELNKPEPIFEMRDPGVHFSHTIAEPLKSSFMHIVRNCVDHGIESVKERLQASKSEQGTIFFEIHSKTNCVEIHIMDDGRGLALHKLYGIAITKNILSADQKYSPDDIAQLIFHSGLSTADKVTQVSGRGVGMEAVTAFLAKQGGNISINLLKVPKNELTFTPFEFIITIPDGKYWLP